MLLKVVKSETQLFRSVIYSLVKNFINLGNKMNKNTLIVVKCKGLGLFLVFSSPPSHRYHLSDISKSWKPPSLQNFMKIFMPVLLPSPAVRLQAKPSFAFVCINPRFIFSISLISEIHFFDCFQLLQFRFL